MSPSVPALFSLLFHHPEAQRGELQEAAASFSTTLGCFKLNCKSYSSVIASSVVDYAWLWGRLQNGHSIVDTVHGHLEFPDGNSGEETPMPMQRVK